MINPFEYKTPEKIPAEDVVDLFVPVFKEYFNVPDAGHTFIHGPRGSGKSMIFRYMAPDCQCIVTGNKIEQLDYFSIHIPIKEGHLSKADLSIIENKHGEAILNEHFMVINFAIKIFDSLIQTEFDKAQDNFEELKIFFNNTFSKALKYSNWKQTETLESEAKSVSDVFNQMKEICSEINYRFNTDYIFQLSCVGGPIPYRGAICTFSDFLFPLLEKITKLSFMPKGSIYLLVDDADNLSNIQIKILNYWVSLRTTKIVCFKISTQLNYPTYNTVNNSRIDTPHDYSEINISEIYTTRKSLYTKRVSEAVQKRLNKFGFKGVEAEDFFPEDVEQEQKVQKIINEYRLKFDGKKGYDHAYRYARSDFMKSLKGNLNTYSYAGFVNLVQASSGVMRHFLEFSSKMFAHQLIKSGEEGFNCINAGIQDEEIKGYSNWFFDENFSRLRDDDDNSKDEISDWDKLRNLIEALGQTFNLILLSDASERRVFSFALQNEPGEELRRILKLGVQTGYFQKSLIGNKRGTGKAQLYILNRLLAPYFKLDPTNFAGYKFVTCDVLDEALYKPNTIIGRVKSKGVDKIFNDPQMLLFEDN